MTREARRGVEEQLSPTVRDVVVRIRTARNQREGRAAMDDLVALSSSRRYFDDIEIIMASPRFDTAEYSRRLPWRVRVHVLEECIERGGLALAERVYAALRAKRMRTMCRWAVDSICRLAEQPWAIQFAERRLKEHRKAVLDAIDTARFSDVIHPEYARRAIKLLRREGYGPDDETVQALARSLNQRGRRPSR